MNSSVRTLRDTARQGLPMCLLRAFVGSTRSCVLLRSSSVRVIHVAPSKQPSAVLICAPGNSVGALVMALRSLPPPTLRRRRHSRRLTRPRRAVLGPPSHVHQRAVYAAGLAVECTHRPQVSFVDLMAPVALRCGNSYRQGTKNTSKRTQHRHLSNVLPIPVPNVWRRAFVRRYPCVIFVVALGLLEPWITFVPLGMRSASNRHFLQITKPFSPGFMCCRLSLPSIHIGR
jgi:hypothetical protein